ncbi:MAG: copper-binding protein [Herpetosiphonaceae bacterium]|nr:MAG: copper-binding protein [Herpetosiphonaceae bacterium]
MAVERFNVPGVSCNHCVQAISKEVGAVPGVKKVEVGLQDKVVTVEHEGSVSREAIIDAINEAGYDVSPYDSTIGLQQA